MAKLIDHQPVPICLVNIAQNHKQEEWDGKRKVSEQEKIWEGNERGAREGESEVERRGSWRGGKKRTKKLEDKKVKESGIKDREKTNNITRRKEQVKEIREGEGMTQVIVR